eukprot:3685652-Prymnesium_polylepis.1
MFVCRVLVRETVELQGAGDRAGWGGGGAGGRWCPLTDAGRAVSWWGGRGFHTTYRAPSPNCGCCGFKERVSLLLRKRGFAEARPWGIASAGSMYKDVQRTNVNEVFAVPMALRGPRKPTRRVPARRAFAPTQS